MDAQLSQIYGTGNNAEDDQVKLAAAELLVKLAEENNVDLNQFSDAEVAQMINELHKTAEFPPVAEGEKKEEKKESKETPESKDSSESSESAEKAAEEKVAEADFLGRVMAHSFNQELTEIQKEAGLKDVAGKAGKSVGEFFKSRGKSVSEAGAAAKSAVTGKGRLIDGGRSAEKNLGKMDRLKSLGYAAKKVAPEAGLLAAGGGAAGLAMRGKKKESSALDTLASERAWELAKEAGWVDAEGNLVVPQTEEKVASQVDIEVERRALQMLEAEGLPIQWNE
ncbi:hypothetical protein UFOVP276_59 [uncultured Caudovirales phage]|uniref:Uncharacterized protein n=1 Tax=uncultured Caudovirales phage TaxID=2100421 RepID=A0A6J5LC47_9CAUD|nr:hypothetical protein UFOVP127_196 [uncultured Caudovirales phage]CAB4135065.1 hypothetical protein UFOVP276_59 [uncultured Caudovirales phage]